VTPGEPPQETVLRQLPWKADVTNGEWRGTSPNGLVWEWIGDHVGSTPTNPVVEIKCAMCVSQPETDAQTGGSTPW